MKAVEVMKDWELVRAKFLFRRLRLPPPEDVGVVTAFRDGEVTLRENRRTEGFTFASKEIGYQAVRPGDLVIHAMDAFAGAIGISDSYGKCSPVYSVCQPKRELDVRYYAYLLRHFALSGRIESLTQGIRERSTDFRFNVFGELRLPYFDVDEQRAIATFLDRETEKIDILIGKKRRLLELLEEKRTALITRAVTRGLDPDVPMKDSGVEWIGEIPEHWEAIKVRWLILKDNAGEVIDKSHWGEGEEVLYSCQRTPMLSSFSEFPAHRRTSAGDLLLTRNGTPYVHLPEAGSIYTNVVQRVVLRPGVHVPFIRYALAQAALSLRGFGDIIESFNMGTWRNLSVPLPPPDEQPRIAERIEHVANRISNLEDSTRRAISLLKEYRTALISAAVTGQIDVRDKVPA